MLLKTTPYDDRNKNAHAIYFCHASCVLEIVLTSMYLLLLVDVLKKKNMNQNNIKQMKILNEVKARVRNDNSLRGC